MTSSVAARIVVAVGMIVTAMILHFGICEWVLTSQPYAPQNHTYLIVLSRTTEDVNIPSLGTVKSTAAARVLRAALGTSPAEGWTFGVAAPFLLLVLAAATLLPVRGLRRLGRGCCPRCGHDLRFAFDRPCHECGWRRPSASLRPDA